MPALTARRRARGLFAALLLATLGVLWLRGIAEAHAKLVSSEPAAGSVLSASPGRVRLVFSERVELRLSAISLVDAKGQASSLVLHSDSADAHAIVAAVPTLAAGEYRVAWRVVSADGHPSQGSFLFTVSPPMRRDTVPADTARAAIAPPAPPVERGENAVAIAGAPVLLSVARGLGVGALMGAAGLLLFLLWSDARARRPRRLAAWLSAAALVLLAAELVLWLAHTSPTGHVNAEWARNALATPTGSRELWRLVLVLLASGSVVLSRRPTLGFSLAALALLVSGAIGHTAGIHPLMAIPAKVLHLLAGAVWFGGLLWLIVRERDDATRYRLEALRVSSAAFVGVIVIAISGVAQTVLFLDAPADLVRSAYGWVVLLKIAGLLVLVLFGAYHRYRVLPRLHASADARRLGRSVSREVVVLVLVLLLGGLLANIAPPGEGRPGLAGKAGPINHEVQQWAKDSNYEGHQGRRTTTTKNSYRGRQQQRRTATTKYFVVNAFRG